MNLRQRLREIEERLRSIDTELDQEGADIEALNNEVDELLAEQRNIQTKLRVAEGINSGVVATRTIGTFDGGFGANPTDESLEYRKAFMDYVLRGQKSPVLEQRADATTVTADIGSVIPETILNQIVEKMKAHGMIWNRISKTNVKGGVKIPTSSLKPVATWTAEGVVSDKQKKTTGSVTFSYHKLQCRVAVTLEADTVSLDVFEQSIVENIYEAIIVAIEEAVVSGSGSGAPLGIINDTTIPAGQKIDVDQNEVKSYTAWTSIVSNIPLAYESKVALVMTKKDWDTNIVGMVDTNGQPVARVAFGLNGRPERRFLGYEVILVDDYLPSHSAAADGDTFAFFADLNEYVFNSNMQLRYKKYFDEDTDEWIDKATLIADGKLKSPHSVILLNKVTAV